MPTDQEHPAWTWEDALLFLGSYLPASLLGALLAQLVPKSFGAGAGRALCAQAIVYCLSVLAIAALVRMRSPLPVGEALGWRMPWRAVPLALLGGPALAVALNLVAYLLAARNLDTKVKDWLADGRALPLVAIFIVVLAPVVEELVFRGFLQPLAMRTLGAVAGIALVAALFALLHGPTYQWSWQHLVVMALAGAAFGWLRYRTGSTAAAALLHSSYNGTMLYAYLVQP